jgi:hypothetical protein
MSKQSNDADRKKTSINRRLTPKASIDPGSHPEVPLAPVNSRAQREQTHNSRRKRTSVS